MTGNPGNRGFGRYLRQRIHLVVHRERTLVGKAITVAYLGSYLTDHIVYAVKAALRLLDDREWSDAEEHAHWAENYHAVVSKLVKELTDGPAILDELPLLERYTHLPPTIFRRRARHWRVLHAVLHGGLADVAGNAAEIPLVSRIHDILNGAMDEAGKAKSVCLTASLLADMECWSSHLPWPDAYTKVMTELYPVLRRYPDVLEALIRIE